MSNSYFQFKQFTIHQDRCAMKVTTDSCLFGAWSGRVIRSQPAVPRLLDIGTGTGLLSLMLAQQHEAIIDAIEIEKDAADQATENIAASPWADRVKIIHADAGKFRFRDKYNLIISNPPFYEKELKGDDVKKNIAHHNEGLLLPGLLAIVKNNLEIDGSFFLLLPYKRMEEFKNLFLENGLVIQRLLFVKQSVDHDYFRIMLEGKFKPVATNRVTEIQEDQISIKDSEGQYTPAFINLLKDYYLHL